MQPILTYYITFQNFLYLCIFNQYLRIYVKGVDWRIVNGNNTKIKVTFISRELLNEFWYNNLFH